VTQPVPPLCVVGPLPPPAGGMANQCEQLVRLLRRDGVQVELVRTNAPYRPAWIGRIPVLRAVIRLPLYAWQLWRAAGRAEVMHVLANSGWSWHLFAAPAIVIGRMRGLRVIVNYRGGNAQSFLARSSRLVLPTLRRSHALVTPSSFLQRVFSAYGLSAQVIPNIVDLSRFKPAPARDFGTAPHLIVTRNLEPIYDIPTAIRAFALVREAFPAAKLTVAGSGPELPRLQELVAELGLGECVRFSGRIDNADIPALYASADCVLNPSTVDNMPISILEAHASGVPVVSTNVGGIPDIVEDGVTALLVPASDHRAMAQAAITVLSDRPFAQRMREAALDSVGRYAWPVVREQWLRMYRTPERMMENVAT
jgi:glycosyltransferase involved in cell wall biosynthesis